MWVAEGDRVGAADRDPGHVEGDLDGKRHRSPQHARAGREHRHARHRLRQPRRRPGEPSSRKQREWRLR